MPTPPTVARTLADLRPRVADWRRAGDAVALVPTMGALHSGHLDLVKIARGQGRRVVVSIFVNPTQFAPHEDLARYPRDEAGDLAKLAPHGVDLVWSPTPDVMYPPGFATRIEPRGAAEGLETEFRPHFFGGVATVCCKLFCQVAPDVAVFGEKDYQQLAVVRQLVRDLDLPLEIIGAPTTREADGLAMSSRNAYLTTAERAVAPAIHRAIRAVAVTLAADRAQRTPEAIARLTAAARAEIQAAGFAKIDYVEVRDAATLRAPDLPSEAARPLRVLAAAWLGRTRLIDNVPV